MRDEDFEHKLEHVARYIAFLGYLASVLDIDRVKLIDTVSEEPFAKPVNVDLVLDVGNSRTCGILIESFASDDQVDLGNSMVLQLRDLSRPECVYSEPFESHVELAQADLDPNGFPKPRAASRLSSGPALSELDRKRPGLGKRPKAASGVGHVQPQALSLGHHAGLEPWRFQPKDYDDLGLGPMIDRASRLLMNARGDVLSEVKTERAFTKACHKIGNRQPARFWPAARSFAIVVLHFLVAEIVAQALSMINNFQVRQQRKFTNFPRRLNRLILTRRRRCLSVSSGSCEAEYGALAARVGTHGLEQARETRFCVRRRLSCVGTRRAAFFRLSLYGDRSKTRRRRAGIFPLAGRPASFADIDQKRPEGHGGPFRRLASPASISAAALPIS